MKTGDLLFLGASEKPLARAIAESTGGAALSYAHVGILRKRGALWFLLHASSHGGCQEEALPETLARPHGALHVYRPARGISWAPEEVIARAEKAVGLPYNFSFSPDGPGYYCASFVEMAFRPFHLFHPVPMHFGSGAARGFWEGYFEKLGTPLPEGAPGFSPNGLIEEGTLEKIGLLSDLLSSPRKAGRIYGLLTDEEGRCAHYHSPLDVAALRCGRCGRYYSCYQCHDALEDHSFEPAPVTDPQPVLCGVCGRALSLEEYQRGHCPHCGHSFNPGCRKHYSMYFESCKDTQRKGSHES